LVRRSKLATKVMHVWQSKKRLNGGAGKNINGAKKV